MARGSNGPDDGVYAQCQDFVATGGISGQDGSCCKVDSALFDGWCLKVPILSAQCAAVIAGQKLSF